MGMCSTTLTAATCPDLAVRSLTSTSVQRVIIVGVEVLDFNVLTRDISRLDCNSTRLNHR